MPLKGDVASFSLPEIFNSLALNQSTGTLMVSDGETRHHLYFQGGAIIPLSDGKQYMERIGDHLFQNRQITDETLKKAREIESATRRRMVDILVEEGMVKGEDLFISVKEKLQEEIYNLFLWKDAFFEFKKDEAPAEYASDIEELARFTFNSGQILMEAARRADEWNRIKARIPSLRYIFTKRKEAPLALGEKADNPVPLDKIEPLLRHSNNIADIVEATGHSKFDVCKTLYLLLLDWQARSLPPAEAEAHFKDAVRDGNFLQAIKYFEYAMELGLGARDTVEKMQVSLFSDPRFMQTTESVRISGNLENVNFSSLFITMFLKKHTGTVRVTDPDSKKIIYISPSEISILSHGNREQAQLGQILVREGKITCRQLDKALTESKKTGEMLGKTLLSSGAITQDDLQFAVRKKISDEVFDIFLWRNAHFEFIKNRQPEEFDVPKARVVKLSLVLGALQKELVSNLNHFGEISKQISTRAIFKRESKKAKKDQKGVFSTWLSKMDDPAQETPEGLLRHVDGEKTVRDIIRVSRQSAIEVAEELYTWMNRGEIRPLALEETKASAEKALKEGSLDSCIKFCEYGIEKGGDPGFFQKTLEQIKAQAPETVESTREFKLEGDFMTFSLAELFQSLFINKHSGTLVVTDGANEKMVYFSKGVIYLLTKGSRSVSRLGDILIDAGKIKDSDVGRALEIQKGSGKLLGEILVEEGIVSDSDISEAVQEKIREELFDIFLWDNAHFTFTKNYFPDEFSEQKGVTKMSLDTGRILMKAVSRIEEWNRIQNAFKSSKSVPYVTDQAKIAQESLDRKQRVVLNLASGRNNIDDVVEQSRVGKFDVYKILYDWKKRGAVAEMDLQALNREAEKAFEDKSFELCVKYYEAAMQFDTENEFLRQYLEMIKGNIAPGVGRKKIVMKGFDLTTLFRTLLRDRTSGTLTAKDAKSRRFFYIAPDEFVALAEGERKSRTVEDVLVESGKATDKQIGRAREYAQKMNAGFADILEKQGVISRKEVDAAAGELAVAMLFELFDWTEVNIEFEASSFPAVLEDPGKAVIEIKASSWPLMESALAKHETLESFKKVIPSTDIIFTMTPGLELDVSSLPAPRRAVAGLIDGRRKFIDVLVLSGLPSFEAYSAAAKLIERAIMRPLTTAEAIKEAENSKVFNEFEAALAFFKSALACDPHNNEIKEKIEALKRSIVSGVSEVPGSEPVTGVSLADLLKNLLRNPKTGTLQAKDRDSERMIHISPDRVMTVSTGSRQGRRIGEILADCRMASMQHVEKALEFQKKSPKRLGEILLLQGVVTEKDVDEGMKEKVLGDLGDLFGWDKASFSFTEGEPPDIFGSGELPVAEYPCGAKEIIEEALERNSLAPKIDALLRSPYMIFRLTEAGQAAAGSGAYTNRVLKYVDGKLNLDAISQKLKGSRFSLRSEIYKLVQNGVIEALPADLARKKGHELYMFNDFEGCASLYRWALELAPGDERMIRNLERAEKYLKGGGEPA